MLIDIDGLNLYNTQGHWLGDKILDAVGNCIRRAGVDLLSRAAGDTFIAVRIRELPDAWLNNVREELYCLPIDDWLLESWFKGRLKSRPVEPMRPISISVGLAFSPRDGNSADTLFKVAYERLALEKQEKGETALTGGEVRQLGGKDQPVGNSFNTESPEPSRPAKESSLLERVANLETRSFSLACSQAQTYLKSKQYQHAIELYTLAIALYPTHLAVSQAYLSRGYAYFLNQDYQRAIADFTQASFLDPINANIYALRGQAYLWIKDVRRAQADYHRSYELDPMHISGAWMAEWAAMGKKPLTIEAATRLEKIGAFVPKDYIALVSRGVALGLRGKPKEGLEELEKAISLKPGEWDAHFWKGMLSAYAYPRGFRQAVRAIEQALILKLPPVLLTPLYWLQIDRPYCFGRCRVYLERYLGDNQGGSGRDGLISPSSALYKQADTSRLMLDQAGGNMDAP